MATNAFKETKLSSTLCHRISPPSSPSRMRIRTASQAAAPSTNKPRSKLLATLDAEIPTWLAGPSPPSSFSDTANTLKRKATPPLADPKPTHPFLMGSQPKSGSDEPKPRERSRTAPASTSSKGKSRARPIASAPSLPQSDIENCSEAAMDVDAANQGLPVHLPLYSYKDYSPSPAVVYTQDEEEANDLVQCLKGPVLGFDLEWVVLFRRNRSMMSHRTALVQLCDARMIVLVQVSSMKKFPQKVKELIENKDIAKVGANIKNDGQKLFGDYGVLARNLVELGTIARHVDPSFAAVHKRKIVSLAKVVAFYTHKTLSKGPVRSSNWEAKPLSEAQKTYAANDAHCALTVYNRLASIAKDARIELKPETFGADLAYEYQAKTASTTAGTSSSTTSTISGPVSSATAAEPPSRIPGTASHRSLYARPLVYTGEQSSSSSRASIDGITNGSVAAPGPPKLSVVQEPPRPQHLRAYNLWHRRNLPLHDICAALRSKDNPLADSTVISYVVRALQADPTLPFSMDRLKELVQLEAGSWMRHKDWILQMDGYRK
ncbi:ribonuclease H-like domain-containing protein [Trametes polyzona]|nr:ribonuclease H-like domain-containing protein [Trametes polyzona]